MKSAEGTTQGKWDARHQASRGKDLSLPSSWLVRFTADLKEPSDPPRALDVACGRGRHAVYLARLGFQVDAVDISPVAVRDLDRRAKDEGLRINARAVDLSRAEGRASLSSDTYDWVLVFRYLDRDLSSTLERILKPGGQLIYETFLATPSSSMNPAFLLQPGELPRLFPSLEVVESEEIEPDEVSSERPVARLLARRPA